MSRQAMRSLAMIGMLIGAACPCQDRAFAPDVPWGTRYAGTWRTIVSGRRDHITVDDIAEAIRTIAATSGATPECQSAAQRWTAAFRKWIESAKAGVVQAGSEYTQTEIFVYGKFGYYQRNEHADGYVSGAEYVPGGVMRGVEQKLRTKGLWIERQTFVGMDDVFWQDGDDESLYSLPSLVLIAEEYRLLADYVEREGEAIGAPGTFVYSGPTPPLAWVSYAPWYDVGWDSIVLRKKEGGSGIVSVRDNRGGVLQETRVRYGAKGEPCDVGKVMYMPYSSQVYNQVEIRLVGREAVSDVDPDLQMVAQVPFAADCILDKRFHNFELPMKTALSGDDAIKEYVGLPREDSVDGASKAANANNFAQAVATSGGNDSVGRGMPGSLLLNVFAALASLLALCWILRRKAMR